MHALLFFFLADILPTCNTPARAPAVDENTPKKKGHKGQYKTVSIFNQTKKIKNRILIIKSIYYYSQFCVFCKNNGETEQVYTSHKLKDNRNRTMCPRLREYKCTLCGGFGDNAHTIKYCPQKEVTVDSARLLAAIRKQ